jgi:branched-subunit amino acid aminotransferase/4-amino-4-deoxychorismate lyase
MKRVLVLVVALLTMLAFASGVMAQAPAKTEKPAATAPEKAAPAPAPKAAAEKPKAEKPKALKATGAVAAYEAGKTIAVKGKDKEMKFDITADTKVKGEVKEGAKVNVTYKKDGDKMVATSISGPTPKKAPPKPKEPPKAKESLK